MVPDQTIFSQLQPALAEALHVAPDQITPNLAFGGIPQWDSMGHMGVMLLLEERFHIPIDADMIASLTSVPSICEYLEKFGDAK